MRLRSVFVAAVTLAALWTSACGDDEGGNGNAGPGASGTVTGSGGDSQGGGGAGASGSGGDAEVPPYCLLACNTTADCDLGWAPYEPDNYSCDGGGCVYTGCNSDAECQMPDKPVCHDWQGVPICMRSCSTPADCDTGNGPAYDADHYDCEQGACVYTGCKSDAECAASNLASVLCRDSYGPPHCVPTCITAADCATVQGPAFDADNFSCDDGGCIYIGCNSDSECNDNSVCR